MQSINSIETYAHRTSKDLVFNKEEITCDIIKLQYELHVKLQYNKTIFKSLTLIILQNNI